MLFETKTANERYAFKKNDSTGKTFSDAFSSQRQEIAPKIEETMKTNKFFSKENTLSFIKGGAIGLYVGYAWLNMYRLDVPPLTILSFGAASVAMNYSQLARTFKKGFQKGVVVATPIFAILTGECPAVTSIAMFAMSTAWGIYSIINEKMKNTKE